jgi:hypothetical protein
MAKVITSIRFITFALIVSRLASDESIAGYIHTFAVKVLLFLPFYAFNPLARYCVICLNNATKHSAGLSGPMA